MAYSASNPTEVDWRSNLVAIKNQKSCGSCWSFSANAAIEFAYNSLTNAKTPVSFSEQQLVDCSKGYPENGGCQGGLMDSAFQYVTDFGSENQASYPYVGWLSLKCKYDAKKVVLKPKQLSGYVDVKAKDGQALEDAVAKRVVSIAIDASEL